MHLTTNRSGQKPIRVLQAQDLLEQIRQDVSLHLKSEGPRLLPGRYQLDHHIHVVEGLGSDWVLCPIEKEPLYRQGKLPMPNGRERQRQFRQLEELVASTFSPGKVRLRYYMVHELLSRGQKEEIERSQHIPIELIEPISKQEFIRDQARHARGELASWSKPRLARLTNAIKEIAPTVAIVLGGIIAAVLAVVVIVALVQALLTILVAVVVGFVLIAGLASGADPIVLVAIEDEEGVSCVYRLFEYAYPVRRLSS